MLSKAGGTAVLTHYLRAVLLAEELYQFTRQPRSQE